jgi:hypothetical protein
MGRIVIPTPMRAARAPYRRQYMRQRRAERPRFGKDEFGMLMKAIDMAIGIGGQIAGAAQRGSRPKPSIPTPQAEGEASVRSALAAEELSGALSSGPAAFQGALAETLPGGGAIEVSETLTPRRGLSPVVAGAAGAPEDIQGEYDVGVEAGRRAAIEKIAMGTTPERQRQVVAESSPAMVSGSWGSPASLDAVPISVASSPAISRESTPGPLGPALRNFLAQTPRTAPQASPAAAPAPAAAGRLTVSDVLQQLRREQAEREAQRSALMQIPQDLEGRGLGELRALMGFADSAEEAQRIMAAVRSSPDVQWTGIEDMTTGAHIARAQNFVAKGLRKHTAGRGTSTAAQMEDLLRTQAYMDTSAARAEASRASAEAARARASLIAKQEAELQAELDESAARAARRAAALKRRRPRDSKKESMYSFYVQHWAKHDRREMSDEEWAAGAGDLANVGPGGLRRWAETNRLSRATRKAATQDANTVMRLRSPKPPAPTRTVLTPGEEIRLETNITNLETQEADARSKVRGLEATLSNTKALKLAEKRGISKAQIQARIDGEKEKARVAREGIKARKARLNARPEASTPAPSGSGNSPEDPIRL